jgi:hypothetical protein
MNSARRSALRLALFLGCVDVEPNLNGSTYKDHLAALNSQFLSIDIELRKEARRKGRKRIREARGLEKAAGHLIPTLQPTPPERGRWARKYELSRTKTQHWPPETPPCAVCRMGCGLPKRSWPSREIAEGIRLRQNDPLLVGYECPAQPGLWHLGHRKTSNIRGSAIS